METEMDLIIIGGGPAGLAASMVAARSGCSTIVLNKTRSFPGDPSLHPLESIHPGVEQLLKYLQADEAIASAKRAAYTGIHSGEHFTSLNPSSEEAWTGFHIDKKSFDASLTNTAISYGVTVLDNEQITSIEFHDHNHVIRTASRKHFTAKFLIDASGRSRLLGKKLKLTEKFLSPRLVAWSGVAENVAPHLLHELGTRFTPTQNGWTWFAPEPPGRCTWTSFSLKDDCTLCAPDELLPFDNQPNIRSANVSWRVFRPLFAKRILLTGDAAGILDPGTGLGILNAIQSGIEAGKAIVSAITEPQLEQYFFQEYDNWFMLNYYDQAKKLRGHYENLGIRF